MRRKQREAQQVIRQHDSDATKIQKLLKEVDNLKQHQTDLKHSMKSKSDERESERDKRERQLMELQKQMRQLEAQNVRYSNNLRAKEEAVGRLQQQLNLEKSKTKQLTEKQAVMQREVVQKQSWLDKEIEIQKRKRDAQERLTRELKRRERILKEREDNHHQRDDMRRIKEQHDLVRLERGMQGWDTQIVSITSKLESAKLEMDAIPDAQRVTSNARYVDVKKNIDALEANYQSAKGAYHEIAEAQAEAARLDNQLRQLDDRIDVLQATLEYGEDIIMQTENEIEALSQEDADIQLENKSKSRSPSAEHSVAVETPRQGGGGGGGGAGGDADGAATSPSTSEGSRSEKRPTHDQYQQTLQQYAQKVQALSKNDHEKEKEIRTLREECEDKTQTIEKLQNALKLADMGFSRRLLKVCQLFVVNNWGEGYTMDVQST